MCRQHVEAALKNRPTKILLLVVAVLFIKVVILSAFFPDISISSIHKNLFQASPIIILGIVFVVLVLHMKLFMGSIKKHFKDNES